MTTLVPLTRRELGHELDRLQLAHQPVPNSRCKPVEDGVADRVGLPGLLGSHGCCPVLRCARQRALGKQDYLRKKCSTSAGAKNSCVMTRHRASGPVV